MHDLTAESKPTPFSFARYWILFGAWGAAAAIAAAGGLVSPERPFVIPAFLFTTTFLLWLAYRRLLHFRRFCDRLDLRWVLAYHGLRAPIGASFLWLMSRGQLGPEFALVAGWGDIAAGLCGLALIPFAHARTPGARRALWTWNALGLLDIVVVVLTAQRIVLFGDDLAPVLFLLTFPGPMLPLFVVPLVIASHLLVFARLGLRARQQAARAT